MKTLTFYGASDDLFEVDSTVRADREEYSCYDTSCTVKVVDGDFGLFVTGLYAPSGEGTWMIGISQLNEDIPLPPWPMRWTADGYSVRLVLEVSDSTTITRVMPE